MNKVSDESQLSTMKKGIQKQQLYFSSSNEENEEADNPSTQMSDDKTKEVKANTIKQMSSLQILDVFGDSSQFQELLKNSEDNPDMFEMFIWRVHFLLGETVMTIQKVLVDHGSLKDCLLFENAQIQRIAYQLIDKAKEVPVSQEFTKIKTHIDQFYKYNDYDTQKMLILYGEFVKLSRKIMVFQMVLDFCTIQEELQRKRNLYDKANTLNAINQNYNQPTINNINGFRTPSVNSSQINSNNIQMAYSNGQRFGASTPINGHSGVASSVAKTSQFDKMGVRKWSPTQEAIFCKIYSETDSPVVCVQLMEKQIGSNDRWNTPKQIQDKMSSLVEKVFQKFDSLSTNNQYIKTFRENKKILKDCQLSTKKKIYRNIAIIYQSMLNVSEQKKAVISQKILQVNRLCRDAAHMK